MLPLLPQRPAKAGRASGALFMIVYVGIIGIEHKNNLERLSSWLFFPRAVFTQE
jgi:hypothetical protein